MDNWRTVFLNWWILLWFWVIILTGAALSAAFLYSIDLHHSVSAVATRIRGQPYNQTASSAPAELAQTIDSVLVQPVLPHAETAATLAQPQAPRKKNAGDESEANKSTSGAASLGGSTSTLPLVDAKLRLYERARAAADAGDFDEAERSLTAASKLRLPGTPTASWEVFGKSTSGPNHEQPTKVAAAPAANTEAPTVPSGDVKDANRAPSRAASKESFKSETTTPTLMGKDSEFRWAKDILAHVRQSHD